MRGWRALVVALTLATSATLATPARAEPSERDRKAAQASFQEAQKAFKAGDFRHAAEKFDEAYKRAPHHAPLWNAGRAWHRAGEIKRAANIYAKYLREAPPKAPDRNRAIVALKEVQAKLGRIDVHATDVGEVTVDGEPFEGEGVYVVPGAHVVEGKTTNDAHESVRIPQSVAAGETVSVALVPPSPPPAPAPAPAAPVAVLIPATVPAQPGAAARSSSGISPAFFVVGSVLTLAAGGVTVWSGLDVSKKKDAYLGGAQTQEKYDAGKAAELRTNVLLGVTGGLALLTAITGLFLVDWKGDDGKDHVTAKLGPGHLFVEGSF
jgi:tetratricopeptide (TPR) repeat protein